MNRKSGKKHLLILTIISLIFSGNVFSSPKEEYSEILFTNERNVTSRSGDEVADLQDLARESMRRVYLQYEEQARANFTPRMEIIEKVIIDDYERWHLKYLVDENEYGFAYLLVPMKVIEDNTSAPLVLCLHPTYFGGKDRVVGIYDDEPKNRTEATKRINYTYAVDLVKRGFVTFAPDKPAYGERRINTQNEDFLEEQRQYTRKLQEKYPKWGLNGKSVYDLKIALDYLVEMPFINDSAIGSLGHSLGAWDTLLLAALDDRIKTAVNNSGAMLQYEAAFWNDNGFLTSYLEGNQNGNLNRNTNIFYMLISPRSLLTTYSLKDPFYKAEKPQLLDGYRDVVEYYKKVNNSNQADFSYYLHPDGHTFTPLTQALIYEWFEEKLK